MTMLQRQAQLGFLVMPGASGSKTNPSSMLRARKDFQALIAECQAIEARERALFLRMRAEGRIPDRSSKS